ncbi:hypothetical protein GCM10010862_51940 [Devosia nitrariae]|uniref:Uncharacterized protein n=1 Tax=Devosia nitrariae TaxID=2071872 RepID=A0ABQ5WCS5_9HYPH|nr:hypothetical protein GCM10010862_51940 [Devosia nitrariae]
MVNIFVGTANKQASLAGLRAAQGRAGKAEPTSAEHAVVAAVQCHCMDDDTVVARNQGQGVLPRLEAIPP